MLCFRYKKLLMPYAENALDERMRNRVTTHVANCKRCADELRVLESMSQELRQVDIPSAEPAPDLWAKVSARIADENIQSVPSRKSWVPKTAAAGLFAVIFAAVVILTNPNIMVEKPQSLSSGVKDSGTRNTAINDPELGTKHNVAAVPGTPAEADNTRVKSAKPRREKPVMMASIPPEENRLDYSNIEPEVSTSIAKEADEHNKALERSPVDSVSPARQLDKIEASIGTKSAPIVGAMPAAPSTSYYHDKVEAAKDAFYSPNAEDKPTTEETLALSHTLGKEDARNRITAGNVNAFALAAGINQKGKEAAREQLSYYKRTSNYAEIVRSASRLIRLDPENAPQYYTDLGFAYAHLGNTAESTRMYRYALDYGNSNTWPATAASIKNTGMLPSIKDVYEDKYEAKNEPLTGKILLELQAVGDNAGEMMSTVQRLLKTDSHNPYYLLKLGEAYERCGNKREAHAAYEKVASGSDAKYAAIAKSKIAAMNK